MVKAGRHKKVFERSRVWSKRNPHQENSEVERGAKWHNVKHEWILLLKDLPSHITKCLGKKIQGEIRRKLKKFDVENTELKRYFITK